MTIELLRVVKKDYIDKICEISAKAYFDDPLFASFVPDISKRMNLRYGFKPFIIYTFRFGEIYITSDIKGFAAWIPPKKAIASTWDILKCHFIKNLRKGKGRKLKSVFNYMDFADKKHKEHASFPHWYLHNIAVEPEFQNQGYGSTLLREMLIKIDEQKLPCYLETQNKKNVALYEKFGFKVLEETIVPNTDFELYFMLRPKVN